MAVVVVALCVLLLRPKRMKPVGLEELRMISAVAARVTHYEDEFNATLSLRLGSTASAPIELHSRGLFKLAKKEQLLAGEMTVDHPGLARPADVYEVAGRLASGKLFSGGQLTNTFFLWNQGNVVTFCHSESAQHMCYTNYSLDLLDTNQVKDVSKQIVAFAFRWYPFLLTANSNAVLGRLVGNVSGVETNGMMVIDWDEQIPPAEEGGDAVATTNICKVHISALSTKHGQILRTTTDLTGLCRFLAKNPRLRNQPLLQLILSNVASVTSIVWHTNIKVGVALPPEYFAARACGTKVDRFRDINW
jgi:hypothetical protein